MQSRQSPLERALPSGGDWPRCLLVSLGLFLAIALVSELRARRAGYQVQFPYVDDLWTRQWLRLESLPSEQTVLIGASRMQYGMHLDAWENRTGERPLMLAWPGAPFSPVLSALARRESFRGNVYCSVAPSFSFAGAKNVWVTQMSGLLHGVAQKRLSLNYHLGRHLRTRLHNNLRILNASAFSPLVNAHQALRLPDRHATLPPLIPLFVRYIDQDLQMRHTHELETNVELQQQVKDIFVTVMAAQQFYGPCDMDLLMPQTVAEVRAIKARSGNVVFVRFPSDGGFLSFESKYYPREAFWDRLVRETGCLGIHFQDHPELKDFLCPEGSHLIESDAIRFTQRFLDIVDGPRKPRLTPRANMPGRPADAQSPKRNE